MIGKKTKQNKVREVERRFIGAVGKLPVVNRHREFVYINTVVMDSR